jgi:hypothetical protein
MSDSRALGLAATPDPLDLIQDARPNCLGSGHMTQVSWGRRYCKTQGTWVRCTFPTPNFLGLEGDARPKLLTTTTTTDFTLKIKSIFFPTVIIFIVNLIILMNLIILLIIIIINLYVQVLKFFNLFLKNIWFFFDGNNNFFSIY